MRLSGYFINLDKWRVFTNASDYEFDRGKDEVCLYSSTLVDWESGKMLEGEMKDLLSKAFRKRAEDKRYIPRLVLSAVIFLALYFFLSLVIRDPIPLVDEIIISLFVSLLFFFRQKSKDGDAALDSMLYKEIAGKIDSSDPVELPFLLELEREYQSFLKMNARDLSSLVSSGNLGVLDIDEDDRFSEFSNLLFAYVKRNEKEMNAFLSLIEKGTYDGIDMTRRILSAYATGAFDLSFLALLVKMKSQKTMR